jgi:hypothetical protein
MEILTNTMPLTNELRLKSGKILRTIGDAASFISNLPKEHDDLLHWTTTGASLEAAAKHPANAALRKTATQYFENALRTENLLKD